MIINIGSKFKIESNLILFLKSHINYTEFNLLESKNIMSSTTIKKFEGLLQNQNFKRVHRSYIVNMEHVVYMSQNEIFLSNGYVLPIARRRKTKDLLSFKWSN